MILVSKVKVLDTNGKKGLGFFWCQRSARDCNDGIWLRNMIETLKNMECQAMSVVGDTVALVRMNSLEEATWCRHLRAIEMSRFWICQNPMWSQVLSDWMAKRLHQICSCLASTLKIVDILIRYPKIQLIFVWNSGWWFDFQKLGKSWLVAWCSSRIVGPQKRLVPAKDQPRAKGGKGIEDMPVAWWKELLIWSVSLWALARLETFVASFHCLWLT